MNGKGSRQRPASVPPATWAERWAQTFGSDCHILNAKVPQKPPLDASTVTSGADSR